VLENQPFNLLECIESSMDLVASKAAEKNLDLLCKIDDDVPENLMGDFTRLRQVLVNLLSNAVKFTDEGRVSVTVTSQKKADRYEICITVRDTGIGIRPDRMGRLFQSFSQVDMSTTRKYGGTGLGLAISKRLIEMMGGKIWAESEVGKAQPSTQSSKHAQHQLEELLQGSSRSSLQGSFRAPKLVCGCFWQRTTL